MVEADRQTPDGVAKNNPWFPRGQASVLSAGHFICEELRPVHLLRYGQALPRKPQRAYCCDQHACIKRCSDLFNNSGRLDRNVTTNTRLPVTLPSLRFPITTSLHDLYFSVATLPHQLELFSAFR